MDIDQFVRNFEDAIEGVEPNTLNPDTQYHKIPQWDSLALLCLLAMIDCEYEVQISGPDLKNADTLRDIFALIEAKKQEAAA